jgi:antitoxin component YwqK of YwqJK toxin-antitoxin module
MTAPINQRDSQGKPHGVWENYYIDSRIRLREHYLHGVPHGIWESYCGDGTLRWRRHWLHGKAHGVWEWYNGHLYDKTYYLCIK